MEEKVAAIIAALRERYPDALCALHYGKDYELMISVRLSAQCTDARVNQVTPALYARFPTLEAFAAAEPEDVEPYVHSCGFYRAKARDIVLCAHKLVAEYGGRVPDTMEALTSLPGVGRKTANLILGDVYHKPAVVVDTNHSNSGKRYLEQVRIAKDVMHSRHESQDIRRLVKGLMVESYLVDGSQKVDGGVFGQSITDPCLGWDKTERLILDLAGLVRA